METAAQNERNTSYYRGLVERIGKVIGQDAYTQDDGGTTEDVLCAKVPELIESMFTSQRDTEDRADNLAVIADALAAELESLTVVDAMVHRLQIRELGDRYRAALRWCLVALEEQATSGFDHRRAVQAARKAMQEV